MAHAFPAHLALNNLDAAFLADYSAMLHALVLAAIAFIVFDRPENLGAKQSITLGFESPVVDSLWFLNFAVRPLANFLRAGQPNANG